MKFIDFAIRIFAAIIVVYVVYTNQQQQGIAILCLLIVIIGIKQINEIFLILKEKIRRAKKLEIRGIGSLEGEETASEKPEELKQLERKIVEKSFHRLVAAGKSYIQENFVEQAIECFEEALAINPRDIGLHLMLGFIYGERVKDKRKAVDHCNQVLEIDPNSVSAQFNLAVYTNHLKGHRKSLALYEKTEELIKAQGITESEIYGKLNLFLGHDIRDSGKVEAAKTRYEAAIAILKKLAGAGDRSSAFWLKNAEQNLEKLQNVKKN